ncbi:DUF2851 family protein [uncultured Bacteroides sp.]|uniref:DUF2851 family protein n=1 Tax=uncultured Bacteroides sp. TaxID=162156 RepID=UPI0035A707DC
MERLLHYVRKHWIFPLTLLRTVSGQPVGVIEPGLPNADAGSGFFNVKLPVSLMQNFWFL